MSDLLDAVIIDPPDGEPDGVVLWLHGLGADGHDFEPIVPMLKTPRLRYVFPHAPEMPVTINMGFVMPAWYDIRTLEAGPNREDAAGIEASAQRIRDLIAAEVERGTPCDRIVLAGFSQGGAMALHAGLRFPESLRGIMALSAYLLLPDRLADEASMANRETPILLAHGRNDDVVPVERGEQTHAALAAFTPERSLTWHDYPMFHEICPDEIAVVGAWLRARYAAA